LVIAAGHSLAGFAILPGCQRRFIGYTNHHLVPGLLFWQCNLLEFSF